MAETEEIERMRKALAFYADPTNYVVSGIVEPPAAPIKADDWGRRARLALANKCCEGGDRDGHAWYCRPNICRPSS